MSTPSPDPASPARRASAREIALVLLITAAALVLRLRGSDFLLPTYPLSDSFAVVQQVDALRGKAWAEGVDPDYSAYPLLLARLTAMLPDPPDVAPGAQPTLEEHLVAASEPWHQIRLVSIVLSVLIVPATWLLARLFLSPGAALLAASLAATSLLHVNFAAQEKPHGPLSAFVPLAVLAAVALRRRVDARSYVLAGAAAGLAVATLHTGVVALAVLPVAFLLRERRPGRASPLWIVPALLAIVGWLYVSYPVLFHPEHESIRVFDAGGGDVLEIPGGNEIHLNLMRGGGFEVTLATLWSNDPVLFVGCALGLVAAAVALARRRPTGGRAKDLAVVLAYVLPYLAIIGLFDNTQQRYLMPLVAFFACFAAYGFERAAAPLLARSAARGPIGAALALAVVAFPLASAWRLGTVRAEPDTYDLAASYLATAAGAEQAILIPSVVDVPLFHSPEALAENARYPMRSNWVRYQMRLPERAGTEGRRVLIAPGVAAEASAALRDDPLGYLRRYDARWVVMPVGEHLARARESLAREAQLVHTVAPEQGFSAETTYYTYQHIHDGHPWSHPLFLGVWRMQRMGQALEIYRLG